LKAGSILPTGNSYFALLILLFAANSRLSASGSSAIYVSPHGKDLSPGTATAPFATLQRAQKAVRERNKTGDVRVILEDGVYPLTAPLRFSTEDGGQGSNHVLWQAAEGAHPLISGGLQVSGWTLFDKEKNIYVAQIPKGLDARQLWVNDVLADRAAIEIAPSDIELTATGFTIKNPDLSYLASIKTPSRLELEATGIFTDRYTPVADISGMAVTLQQSAWENNTWGYDTPNRPYNPEVSRLFLVNALELMGRRHEWHRNQDQWYLSPEEGKLYFKPAEDADIQKLKIVLPHLEALVSISGSYDHPVRNLEFSGLRFSYTSWLGPSQPTGYASQQSGAYLKAVSPVRPADAFKTCGQGCPELESMRLLWDQMPAAIQVSTAENILFDQNIFSQLGQIALGIGNDANANLSGIGLGTNSIHIERNRFAVLAGGAVMAGGVRLDAHHPSSPAMTNRNLLIRDNVITDVAEDYKDIAAILSTYVDTVEIAHNDISDANYDGIDIGWGWGYTDMGGNANYRDNIKGYRYNPLFQTPTTLRNNVVASNRIHGVKRWFMDGGSIYNLSDDPGAEIKENYIFDIGERIGIYLDEGSRHIRVERNVVDTHGYWLTANTLGKQYKLRATADDTASGNWHNSDKTAGNWTEEIDNHILDDSLLPDKNWDKNALRVIQAAGVEPPGERSSSPR
jgi:hypothetical protein